MTWSIVARDAQGLLGVAVASRFFAVGALCPAVRSGRGALSTQALVNPLYARAGLELLDEGLDPAAIVERLTAADPGRESRQLHVIDAQGRSARHTGRDCIAWCGHLAGDGYSMAGNMLAGPAVLDETERAYRDSARLPFAERLIAAMRAGEAAGGDKRGKQAAALLVHGAEDYPLLSLRVDDHPEPLAELERLYRVSLERFQPFVACLPTRADPAGIVDRAEIESRIGRFRAAR
ncbi:MAG TPA: DUF1028 domain-containing protein [Usitatibacter sp.]|nr:DUF1028 domain-containing protein [Usitatibacter sp.]